MMSGAPGSVEHLLRGIVREEVEVVKAEILRAVRAVDGDRVAGGGPSQEGRAYVSTRRAARYADVSEPTVRRWITRGLLPGHRCGRLVRVRLDELDALLSSTRKRTVESVDLDARANEMLKRCLSRAK